MNLAGVLAAQSPTGRGSVGNGCIVVGLGVFIILVGLVLSRVPERRAPVEGWQSMARNLGVWLWTKGMVLIGIATILAGFVIVARA